MTRSIDELHNFGPESALRLAEIGVLTEDDLRTLAPRKLTLGCA
jgi:hypothetical protein